MARRMHKKKIIKTPLGIVETTTKKPKRRTAKEGK